MDSNIEIFHKAIRDYLQRILQSSRFRGSQKQSDFLSFIVNETLEGRASELKGYTIAIAVYGRKEGFDPQVDPIVRVEAGRLRRALEHYYLTDGKDDPVQIDIPKGGYTPTFREIKPQTDEIKSIPGKSDDYGLYNTPSIAVIPLINQSGDPEQDYFVDGLTEELTNELSRYQDFQVIASLSGMRFKGKAINLQKIGGDLGIRFLLSGSARSSPKSVKVGMQLLDTATAEQIWTKSYKRKKTATDLIDLQEDITHSVVGIIADQYGLITRKLSKESRKRAPEQVMAYDAILRFYYYELRLTVDAFKKALSALKKAIQLEPEYGLAWAMLGHMHADNYALGFCEIENSLEKALVYANKGVSLSPENQFANDALCVIYFQQGNKEAFLKQTQKTVELNPNSPYFVGVAGWHTALFGEWEHGLALLKKGMQLNPYHPTWFYIVTSMDCYRREDYESAFAEALKINYPELFWDPLMRAAALGQMGKQPQAEMALKELLKLVPDFKDRGRELIGRYVKVDSIRDKIFKGLKKAGLNKLK